MRRLIHPPALPALPERLRPVWRVLAPQVARWTEVTMLDLAPLAALCAAAADVQKIDSELARLTGPARREGVEIALARRKFLWEVCQEFLLGPEVLEEIVMPDGTPLWALICGGPEHS